MWLEVDIRQAFWIKSPPSHAGWVASHEIPETSNYLILGYVGVIVEKEETLQKAQRTRGLSSAYQSNLFRSYHIIAQVQTQILIKFHLQNLDQASTLKSQPTSASRLNFKFKI